MGRFGRELPRYRRDEMPIRKTTLAAQGDSDYVIEEYRLGTPSVVKPTQID